MSIKITEVREKIAEFVHGERDYDQHDMARDAAEALDYWRAAYVREHQRANLADSQAAGASVACDMLRDRAEKAKAEVARLRADAERLDYIERRFSGVTNRERYLKVEMIWGKGCNGRTLREACDKYMARDVALEPTR